MDKLLKIKEVADIMGVTPQTVYGLINAGALRSYDLKKGINAKNAMHRVAQEDLKKYLAAHGFISKWKVFQNKPPLRAVK